MCVVGGCNTNTAHPAGPKIQDAKDARAAIEGQVAAEVEKQQALSADLQARQQVSCSLSTARTWRRPGSLP